jgi:hypothetical protein
MTKPERMACACLAEAKDKAKEAYDLLSKPGRKPATAIDVLMGQVLCSEIRHLASCVELFYKFDETEEDRKVLRKTT